VVVDTTAVVDGTAEVVAKLDVVVEAMLASGAVSGAEALVVSASLPHETASNTEHAAATHLP
jgi:hypothetical protein